MIKYYKHLKEEITGTTATIYFATENAVNAIRYLQNNSWFSNSNVYGRGIYSVYDINNIRHAAYGRDIVKAEITDLSNYFCFELDTCLTVHPESKKDIDKGMSHIEWQAKKFDCECPSCLGDLYNNYDHEYMQFIRTVDGIIYYGSQDGHCILTYEPSLIKVIAYKKPDEDWVDVKSKDVTSERFGLKIEPLTDTAVEYLQSKGIDQKKNLNNAAVNLIAETKEFKHLLDKEDLEQLLDDTIEANPVNMIVLAYKCYMKHRKEFIERNSAGSSLFGKLSDTAKERIIRKNIMMDNIPLIIKSMLAYFDDLMPGRINYVNPEYVTYESNRERNVSLNENYIQLIDSCLTKQITQDSDLYFPGLITFQLATYIGRWTEYAPSDIICTDKDYLCLYSNAYKQTLRGDKEVTDFVDYVYGEFGRLQGDLISTHLDYILPTD